MSGRAGRAHSRLEDIPMSSTSVLMRPLRFWPALGHHGNPTFPQSSTIGLSYCWGIIYSILGYSSTQYGCCLTDPATAFPAWPRSPRIHLRLSAFFVAHSFIFSSRGRTRTSFVGEGRTSQPISANAATVTDEILALKPPLTIISLGSLWIPGSCLEEVIPPAYLGAVRPFSLPSNLAFHHGQYPKSHR